MCQIHLGLRHSTHPDPPGTDDTFEGTLAWGLPFSVCLNTDFASWEVSPTSLVPLHQRRRHQVHKRVKKKGNKIYEKGINNKEKSTGLSLNSSCWVSCLKRTIIVKESSSTLRKDQSQWAALTTQGNQNKNKIILKSIFTDYDCFNLKGWLQTKKQKNIVTLLPTFLWWISINSEHKIQTAEPHTQDHPKSGPTLHQA